MAQQKFTPVSATTSAIQSVAFGFGATLIRVHLDAGGPVYVAVANATQASSSGCFARMVSTDVQPLVIQVNEHRNGAGVESIGIGVSSSSTGLTATLRVAALRS